MPAGLFTKRRVIGMSCIFAAIVLIAWAFWPASRPVSEPVPSPNGYDDFVQAGRLLVTMPSDYRKLPTEQLQAAVKSNEEPLRLLRIGLSRDCRKPIEYTTNYLATILADLSAIKQLAQVVSAEGVIAEREARFGDAALSYCDTLKLGAASSRGGLVIDHLVGIACEAIGSEGMQRIIEKLSAQEARGGLTKIIEVDRTSDKPEEFIARDLVFTKNTRTIAERLRAMWTYKTLTPEFAGLANYKAKAHQYDRRRRRLIISLASHIYQLENGSPPRQMSDLVPSILPVIPVDPETGTNLVLNPAR